MKRRSGEGNKTYNMRTSMQIKTWYQYFSILFAHQQILKAVYRAAWFDDKIHVGLAARPLHNARNCRNALWWESVSDIPAKRRRLDGVIHARQGHVPAWEDILLQFVGPDWRRQRDQCESLKVWMADWLGFCNRCCTAWSLRLVPERPAVPFQLLLQNERQPSIAFLENTPQPEWPDWFWHWGKGRKRIMLLVDCQALAGLVAGEMALKDDHFRTTCVRMMRCMHRLWHAGWWPKRDCDNYVQWAPRRHNRPADHLANVAMDEAGDFTWCEDLKIDRASLSRIAVTSDGGFRGKMAGSSSAFIVWKLTVASRTAEPIAMSYAFWRCGRSAFEAEIVALDQALRFICEMCSS